MGALRELRATTGIEEDLDDGKLSAEVERPATSHPIGIAKGHRSLSLNNEFEGFPEFQFHQNILLSIQGQFTQPIGNDLFYFRCLLMTCSIFDAPSSRQHKRVPSRWDLSFLLNNTCIETKIR